MSKTIPTRPDFTIFFIQPQKVKKPIPIDHALSVKLAPEISNLDLEIEIVKGPDEFLLEKRALYGSELAVIHRDCEPKLSYSYVEQQSHSSGENKSPRVMIYNPFESPSLEGILQAAKYSQFLKSGLIDFVSPKMFFGKIMTILRDKALDSEDGESNVIPFNMPL